MKEFFSKIRYAGIDSDTDQSDIKCIALSNTVAFLLMLLASGFIPLYLFYWPATEYITYLTLICVASYIGVVILNYYKSICNIFRGWPVKQEKRYKAGS